MFFFKLFFLFLSDSALVQVEAGNRALKTVFSSKLAAKGKSLAGLLQPHTTGKLVFFFLLLCFLTAHVILLESLCISCGIVYKMKHHGPLLLTCI